VTAVVALPMSALGRLINMILETLISLLDNMDFI